MTNQEKKWIVNPRQRCDLELLLVDGFHPLVGFLSQADYEGVLCDMRLANGQLWPMPITLDVNKNFAEKISLGEKIALHDADNTLLAYIKVTDKWQPNKSVEAQTVFGTQDSKHPGVDYLINKAGEWYVGGPIQLIQYPKHYSFEELRHTPFSLRKFFQQSGWQKIIGFQTRNPIHRAHMELTLRAMKQIDGHLLIHPVVGLTRPGDFDYFSRVCAYQKILPYYPQQKVALSLLPLAMRMAGPREALWHAIIRKNYGCNYFIVGRDHAGPGDDASGKPFYEPFAAQMMVEKYQDEIGIKLLQFQEMVYVKERKQYCFANELKSQETALTISGTKLRNDLLNEQPIPEWFSFPEIIQELRNVYLPKYKQGFTLFFTGLSGSGKTTVANALMAKLICIGKRNITVLDGDVVRQILATELGFSKAERNINIRRIGYVASEITKTGGIALCAAIAPYTMARVENRHLISQYGGYIEVYMSTPLGVCEKRDTKKLYAKARNSELKGFTGVDDPYEPPQDAEIIIDTSVLSIEDCVAKIIKFLNDNDYLRLPQESLTKYSVI